MIRQPEALACAAIGVVGALVFLFAFPKGSISTLMHEVLHLPGPGAGIAVVVGPFLMFVTLVSSINSPRAGGAVTAALAFAVACTLVVSLLEIPTNPKGAFGSAVFIAAVTLVGIAAEAVMLLGKAMKKAQRCVLCGAAANAILLVFYWIAVFPRTAGWISWKDVPLLMSLCLACGLVSGYMAWAVSGLLSRILPSGQKE